VTFSLRKYRPQDFESLYAIDQACYQPAIAYSRRDLRNYLRFPGANCLVAEADNQAAAFILTAHDDLWGYIVTIDVLEPCRRLGVGAMLLHEAERELVASGAREVTLETATNNASAIAFWKKHGYRTQGVRKGYYPGGIDAYSMIKTLAPKSSD
jgi:[ribosomal protein S18]-alanine N-acetyltransferase